MPTRLRLKTAIATCAMMLTVHCFAQQTSAPSTSAQAQSIVNGILASQPQMSSQDELGCKILLCLANPNGPEAVSQCVPPIQTLYDILSQTPPGNIPECPMASSSATGPSYATLATNYYSTCPTGTNPLPAGQVAALAGQPVTGTVSGSADSGFTTEFSNVFTGIGNGDGLMPQWDSSAGASTPMPPLVCVGQQVGTITPTNSGGAVFASPYSAGGLMPGGAVPAYNKVVTVQPGSNSRAIDVFISGTLHNVVHY